MARRRVRLRARLTTYAWPLALVGALLSVACSSTRTTKGSCLPSGGSLRLGSETAPISSCGYALGAKPQVILVARRDFSLVVTMRFPDSASVRAGGAVGTGSGAIRVEVQDDKASTRYVATAGEVQMALDGPPPAARGQYARAAVQLAGLVLDTSASKPSGPVLKETKNLTGNATMGFTAVPSSFGCDDVSGGAACTQISACETSDDCVCHRDADGGRVGDPFVCSMNKRCCLMLGARCGTAGGGADCCSGYCSNSGVCATPETDTCKPPPDGGTGGASAAGVWNCIHEPSLEVCDCIRKPSRTDLASCPNLYDCCVLESPGTAQAYCKCTSTARAGLSCTALRDYQRSLGRVANVVPSCPGS